MQRTTLLAALLALGACQTMTQQETAQSALTTFCRLHKADIFATLLTPTQQQAGAIVCLAVGMQLGED